MTPHLSAPTGSVAWPDGSTGSRVRGAILRALKKALVAFFLAVPLGAFQLKGYGVVTRWQVPWVFAAAVLLVALSVEVLAGVPAWRTRWDRLQERRAKRTTTLNEGRLGPRERLALVAVVLAAATVPFVAGNYVLTTLILVMIYLLLALGLSIVVGMAGLLDLGYVAFYATGAYTMALGSHYFGLNVWAAILVAAVLAGLMGGLLAFPVLRVHGDYLAIVTLGFGEIIRLVLNNWRAVTGGPNGMEVAAPTLFGLSFSRRAAGGTFHEFFGLPYSTSYKFAFIYLLLLAVVCIVVFVVRRLRAMPVGRAWEALREDQIACGSLGLNHVTVKLSAFVIGATTGGVAGVFFAVYQGFVNPTSFVFAESALILAIVVLGGMNSIIGIVISAAFLVILPELLRDAAEYRQLVLGIVMVAVMIWRPRGLGSVSRRAYRDGPAAN